MLSASLNKTCPSFYSNKERYIWKRRCGGIHTHTYILTDIYVIIYFCKTLYTVFYNVMNFNVIYYLTFNIIPFV